MTTTREGDLRDAGAPPATMTVRELGTADPEWRSYLARARHDIFQVPEYLRAEDEFHGTTTRLLVVEEGDHALLVPIVLSPLADGLWDASSPFQYAGPVFTADAPAAWRDEAICAALDHLRERGVVSLFLRGHPLFGLDEFARAGTVVDHGPSYVIPLDRPVEEIRAGMRENHRRTLRRAEKAGIVAVQDTEWEHLAAFHDIYTATMERVGARPAYRYSREYLEHLRDAAGEFTSLWVLMLEGEVAGAHLVTECDGTVDYLLGATHPDFHRRVPQVAIFDAVLAWAHARGDRDYFLGGGLQESLRHFKAGFTTAERPVTTARIVIDRIEYDRLRSAWESSTGAQDVGLAGFFPCYRSPLVGVG